MKKSFVSPLGGDESARLNLCSFKKLHARQVELKGL